MTVVQDTVAMEIERVVAGQHHDPHSVLGAHAEPGGADGDSVIVRGYRPEAASMFALVGDQRIRMRRVHGAGVFEARVAADQVSDYRLEVGYPDGLVVTLDDPYRFWPTLGPLDLHLYGEGRHEGLWRHLGAHVRTHQGVAGTSFAVWAPSARSVRVVGDFNGWDGRIHPMRVLGSSGVWELFLPGIGEGARYKYEILTATGHVNLRADPFAFRTEMPPGTASVVDRS